MAVREFNGSTDQLVCGLGGATGMTYGTVAVLVKFTAVNVISALSHLHNSSGTWLAAPLYLLNTGVWSMHDGITDSTGPTAAASTWYLAVVRKATGTATPRYSTYNYSNTTWTHAAGSNTEGNWTAPGAGGNIQFSYQSAAGDQFGGRVAARALWSNTLPWTADASGDTAIQSAGLHTAASSWLANNPTAFWLFNQASTGTAVPDSSTTGTAGQTSLTGTTVINGDDPPGFNFALSAQPVAVQAAGPWPGF